MPDKGKTKGNTTLTLGEEGHLDVFWAPSSADAKAVRYVHHVFCLGQNKSDFI
jgi:hypothetical protein